jgi:TIM-barrel protein
MSNSNDWHERFRPRLALASMSGDSHADWVAERVDWIGAAFMGAFNLDRETLEVARSMVDRGRTEFLPGDPWRFLNEQLSQASELDCVVGANVRAVDPESIHRAGERCAAHGALLEINAHCRQKEMVNLGCGQQLIRDKTRLRDYVQAGAESEATVSLKGRFEVEGADPVRVLNRAVEWGVDCLHVDAMDSEPLIDRLKAPFLIANNGVRDRDDAEEYFHYGADAVSVGRANNEPFLKSLSSAVRELAPERSSSSPPADTWDDRERVRE